MKEWMETKGKKQKQQDVTISQGVATQGKDKKKEAGDGNKETRMQKLEGDISTKRKWCEVYENSATLPSYKTAIRVEDQWIRRIRGAKTQRKIDKEVKKSKKMEKIRCSECEGENAIRRCKG